MKTTWNNRQGSRDRQACAVLVTIDGRVHKFTGTSIPGVCRSDSIGYEKAGKWSNSTYEILFHDTTVFVSWMQSWETGKTWPQVNWEAGFLWIAKQAPSATKPAFDQYIRANYPQTAERWDAVAAGEAEFGKPATMEQLAAIEVAKAEIAQLQVETDAADKANRELNQITAALKSAKQTRDSAAERLASTKIEAEKVAGLNIETLRVETAKIWEEVSRLQDRATEARRNAEAKAAKSKAEIELGNSLGSAFAKFGL